MGGSEEDGELKGKGEKWAVPLILNIPCHGGLLIVQACRPSLPVNLSQTQEKDGEKGTECGWVDIIYHDLSLLEAQNVGGGLDPEKSLAGGLNIVP